MKLYTGYYSIVQFCPDAAKAEVANVGIIIFCPEVKFLDIRLANGNDKIRTFFGSQCFDPNLIEGAKESLQERLIEGKENFQTLTDLNNFINTRANDLRITAPRFLKTENPQQELDNLFKELVGGRSRKLKQKNALLSKIDQLFSRPSLRERIETRKKISLPFIGKTIEFPYAYRNGVQNLIQHPLFSLGNDLWYKRAFELAGEGYSIQKHIGSDNLARKVIIIPIIENASAIQNAEKTIHDIFMDHGIMVVEPSKVEAYVEMVEVEAH
jgi:hypothetical protein